MWRLEGRPPAAGPGASALVGGSQSLGCQAHQGSQLPSPVVPGARGSLKGVAGEEQGP